MVEAVVNRQNTRRIRQRSMRLPRVISPVLLFIGMAVCVLDSSLCDQAYSSDDAQNLTVTGVLERLDLSARKGLIKTATGKPVFFEIVKPELFKDMTVGQRVTLQLDEHGRAIKAIETQSIPELPAPTQ
jgi:hypothetical protein